MSNTDINCNASQHSTVLEVELLQCKGGPQPATIKDTIVLVAVLHPSLFSGGEHVSPRAAIIVLLVDSLKELNPKSAPKQKDVNDEDGHIETQQPSPATCPKRNVHVGFVRS